VSNVPFLSSLGTKETIDTHIRFKWGGWFPNTKSINGGSWFDAHILHPSTNHSDTLGENFLRKYIYCAPVTLAVLGHASRRITKVSFERDLVKQQYRCPFLYPYPGNCLEQNQREKAISLYLSNFYIRQVYMLRMMHQANWKESQRNDDDEDDDSTMDISTDAPTSLVARTANVDYSLEREIPMDTITDGSSNSNFSVDSARNIAMASSSIPLLPAAMLTIARRRRTTLCC
jgi:hypothetical protein